MDGLKQEAKLTTALVGFLLIVPQVASGQQPHADVEGTVHAKGIVVLRLMLPSKVDVSGVSLFFSADGETYEDSQAGLLRGSPLFTSMADDGRTTTIVVSLVGRFPYGTYSFLFEAPGTYHLRWGVGGVQICQTLDVGRSTQADLAFLSRLSDPGLLRQLFGKDPLEGSRNEEFRKWVRSSDGADSRALLVIAELLEATRAREPGDVVREGGGIENALTWADTLLPLAKEFRESSYAPYAAYYAGCCYAAADIGIAVDTVKERRVPGAPKARLGEIEQMAALVRENANYPKALEAYTLAADGADAYLKPRVLFQKAFLHLNTGAYETMEELFSSIEKIAPYDSVLQPRIDKMREGVSEVETLRHRRDSEKTEE